MTVASSIMALPFLARLPVEILLDIYHQLDLDSVFNLSATHSSLHQHFQEQRASILLPVLAREFSPFDELLQVYTASVDDLESAGGLYSPRKIVFRRYPGDEGKILAPRPSHDGHSSATNGHSLAYTDAFNPGQPNGSIKTAIKTAIKTVALSDRDLGPILKLCRVVRQWEERFPQMRWFHDAESCRLLRPHEAVRFRRSFYRWWLYGLYFHGEFPRPRVGLPEPFVEDVRTSQMRHHSTSELLELMDLVETMKDVVAQYLCPRLEPSLHEDECDLMLTESPNRQHTMMAGWTDQSFWGRIVKTYAKLGPTELMDIYENIFSYSPKRLIVEAHLHRPNLTFDQESIQIAIRCALDERCWRERSPSLAEDHGGGIPDFDDERDDERLTFGGDGRPDGSLPAGHRPLRSFSQYSPRGDDGSSLINVSRTGQLNGLLMAHAPMGMALY